jgi:ABC-type antimicrobial peptide transport system ATPase subunit
VDYDGHVRSSVNHFNVFLDIDGNLRSSFHVILNNVGHMRIFFNVIVMNEGSLVDYQPVFPLL